MSESEVKPLSKEEVIQISQSEGNPEDCPRGGPEPQKCDLCSWSTRHLHKNKVWICRIMDQEAKKKH